MRVAIHQPNFFPWLGLIHRLTLVDRFVYFDHVQAPRGKSWLNRNQVLIGGSAKWLTAPVNRAGTSIQPVDEVEVAQLGNFERKHLATLHHSYGRHPHYETLLPMLEGYYAHPSSRIADRNAGFIRTIAEQLDLPVEFESSRQLSQAHPELLNLDGNDLVLATAEAAGASLYISGTGCKDFIDPEAFLARGIGFAFQDFTHPEYPQPGADAFVPRLSIVDALASVGFEGLHDLLVNS